MNPFLAWRFLTEAQTVMLRRSLALWADPHNAAPALAPKLSLDDGEEILPALDGSVAKFARPQR